MKILLINPWYSGGECQSTIINRLLKGKYPPLGLAYIAGVLEEKGHEVKIIDAEAEEIRLKIIAGVVQQYHPALIGITTTTWGFKKARETAQHIKGVMPNVPIVVGGPHLASFPELTMEFKEFDFGVVGEGEITACELADAVEKGGGLDGIKGLVYRKDGVVVKNKSREFIQNLDAIPLPAWHLLPLDRYNDIMARNKKFVTMMSSRGCP